MSVWILDNYYLSVTAVVTVIFELFLFAIAWSVQNDIFTDFAGGVNVVILSLLTFLLNGTYHSRQIIITICGTCYGIRFGGFLLYRYIIDKIDYRFDKIRSIFHKFLSFWIIQMIGVFTVCLPITFTNSPNYSISPSDFGSATDIIGLVLFVIGFVIVTITDFQKFLYRQNRKNSFEIIRTGLWKYSRHPNYFGEIVLWWGIFLISISSYTSNNDNIGFISVLCPVFMSFILLFASGLSITEPEKEKQFLESNQLEAYVQYTQTTSPLIPLPNSFYSKLPRFVKTWILLDLPIYHYSP